MSNENPIIISDERVQLRDAELGILSTLLYFDIFKYPLTGPEIQKFCHSKIHSLNELQEALDFLISKKYINHSNGFYFANSDFSIIERRINGNQLAKNFYPIAKKYSLIISKFPFVRAVFISGSLSKGYMNKESDIDYFIITAPKRLWLCRTMLVLFKKIFLLNSHKYFCVNYFIDENNIEIRDKNIFTATELVTLIPMVNHHLFEKFLKSNDWTKDYMPNINSSGEIQAEKKQRFFFKPFWEKILNGSAGNKLDDLFLKITLKFWKKKFNHFSEEDFKNALRSKKNVSKHHPNKFQERVLVLYDQKIKQFEKSHHVTLTILNEVSTSLFQ